VTGSPTDPFSGEFVRPVSGLGVAAVLAAATFLAAAAIVVALVVFGL
jgi:hypothetical protein